MQSVKIPVIMSVAVALAGAGVVSLVHFDTSQTGAFQETVLTRSNVAGGSFKKLGSWNLTGLLFAQPLYIPSLTISGIVRNVLIAATLNNTLSAFDADRAGSSALWSISFGTGRAWWSNNTSQFYYCSTDCNIGIVGTPVVDVTGGFVYVVSATSTPTYVLHKINLLTGASMATVTISGQVVGTGSSGDPTSGGNLLFSPTTSNQRPGLILSPDAGTVYIGFGGGSAGFIPPPWHGWMFAYATSSLTQTGIFCTSPNGYGASIWQSGGAPAMDSSGNLYVLTGALGDWDGVTEFSDSMLKLSPSLGLLDWFTPSNHATLDANDYDFGTSRVMLVPGTHLAIGAGKDFNVYAVDTTCMGHLQGSSGCTLQTFPTNNGGSVTKFSGSYGGVVTSGGLWLPTTAGSIYSYTLAAGSFSAGASQTNSYGFPGPAQMMETDNAGANGILWVVTAPTSTFEAVGTGTLRALNSSTLAELWNSDTSGQDTLGGMAKFVAPVIVNGKVYVATNSNSVVVYGLPPTGLKLNNATIRGGVGSGIKMR